MFNATARAIDNFTEWTGRIVAWLTLAMMVLMCAVVVMRYLLETGSIALQETISYLHATVFLLAAGYTLKRNGHVRVDVFYRRMSARRQALVDTLGGLLFLLPVCVFIFWLSLNYVAASWQVKEVSTEPGGLPWVYLLKSLLLVMPVLLALQGLAEIIRNLLFLIHKGEAQVTTGGKLL